MTPLLLDLNVVLDHLLDRPPYAVAAQDLWTRAASKELGAYVSAHALPTLFYIGAKGRGPAFARRLVGDVLAVFEVAPVGGDVLRRALALAWPDFEDSVTAVAAEAAGCATIVTRDPRGFAGSPVPAIDPRTALALLAGERGPNRLAEGPGSAPKRRVRGRRSRAFSIGLRRTTRS